MDYPFRMYGRIVQIYRYKAVYAEQQADEQGEIIEIENTVYFPTKEEAEKTGGIITELDTTDYAWLDGLEMPDVSNTRDEAIKVYEMGQDAYYKKINTPDSQADIDAMLIDLEYRMTLLELGVMQDAV